MVYALAALLSAGLLFVLQPALGAWFLPSVGGSPFAWATSLAFFQLAVLAGYAWAHALSRRAERRAAPWHAALVVLAVLDAWLDAPAGEPPVLSGHPALALVGWYARHVGLSAVALSATAPLLQRWAALGARRAPTWLYAVSNVGSLIGLLAYPWLIAPRVALPGFFLGWRVVLTVFAATVLVAALDARARGVRFDALDRERWSQVGAPPDPRSAVGWTALGFFPSALLVAATSHLTLDVAPVPLLWVVPLVVYLLTFVLAFAARGARARWGVVPLLFGGLGLGLDLLTQGAAPLARQVTAPLAVLVGAGLACHGAIAADRRVAAGSTAPYLWLAFGGALGGAASSWVAPLVLRDVIELELLTLVLVLGFASAAGAWPRPARLLLWLGTGVVVPTLALGLLARLQTTTGQGHVVLRSRSWLGPLRVVDTREGRTLTHGRIQHGLELAGDTQRTPTLYFARATAAGRVLQGAPGVARTVGVLGLGAGTLAAYGRPDDEFRFYELDPAVVELARSYFTFLRANPARTEIIVGDGRLSLAREAPHAFDVLVLDAFSGDAVPTHLLTREAFALYVRHLAPNGVILTNLSNRHLALSRVVRASARASGLACAVSESATNRAEHVAHVEWAVLSRDSDRVAALVPEPKAPEGSEVLWTDGSAALWPVLR